MNRQVCIELVQLYIWFLMYLIVDINLSQTNIDDYTLLDTIGMCDMTCGGIFIFTYLFVY